MSNRSKTALLTVLIALPALLSAGEADDFYRQANAFYQEGKYAEALNSYQRVDSLGFSGGALWYNMGNCYFKLDEIGLAVLYYERARKLMPGDEALKFNLELAGLRVVDKITPREEFVLSRILKALLHFLPKIWHLRLIFGLYFTFMAALVLWILARKRLVRVTAFRTGSFLGLLFLIVLMLFVARIRQDRLNVEAIILADKADVLSAPGEDGMDLFALHEGTKVRIDNQSDAWVEVVLADGKVGWVKREVLEII